MATRRTNEEREHYPWSIKSDTSDGVEWMAYPTLKEARNYLSELARFHDDGTTTVRYSDTPWVKRGQLTLTGGLPGHEWTFEIVPLGA